LEVSSGRRNLLVSSVIALDGDGHPSTAAPRGDLPEWPSASHDFH
jgi:hypothetical protein